MTDERWRQIDKLFHEALEQEPGSRALFLDRACATDPSLRKEVEALLRSHEEAGSFLGSPPAVSLVGKNLGPYQVKTRLGSGGMGEVYLAEDSRLGRKVALKTLAPALLRDTQFRARFLREARSVSSLNHPHICTLYDIGQQDGVDYLVMEYLEGEPLADRLKRGRLSSDQALRYAAEIAGALDNAHRHGITHRDLKPANIMLTKSGAKLLDFGLAKTKTKPEELTEARSLTESGMILGTLQYMAPEQVEGKETDARTDIFAFGVVLYEMLTGQKAFQGTSQASLMAAILEHEPPPILPLEPAPPGALDHLIRVCIAKDPDDRWQNARDLERELKWIAESGATVTGAAPSSIPVATRRWVIPAFLALLAIAAVSVRYLKQTPGGTSPITQLQSESSAITHPPTGVEPAAQPDKSSARDQPNRTAIAITPAVTRFDISLQPADQLAGPAIRPMRIGFAWSPDGQLLVFAGNRPGVQGAAKLYSRRLSESEAKPIAGSELAIGPFFSPDGNWIGFWALDPSRLSGPALVGQIKKVPVAGGVPVVICEVPAPPGTFGLFGASWAEDGTIYFSNNGIIQKVSSGGGTPVTVTMNDVVKGEQLVLPQPVPGGKSVIFTSVSGGAWNKAQIVIQSLETHERRVLIQGGADARYVETGHLVYMKTGTLMAVPFDTRKLQVSGDPVALIQNVMQAVDTSSNNDETGAGQWAVSSSGTLVYVTGGVQPWGEQSMVWVDRKGAVQPVPFSSSRAYTTPRLSPDKDRVAVAIHAAGSNNRGSRDIWMYDLLRGAPIRMTSDELSLWPVWSPDGKRLVYSAIESGVPNLYMMNADASGPGQRITSSQYAQAPQSWTDKGNLIAFTELHPPNWQIWVLPMDGDRKPKLFLEGQATLMWPEFSPDGHWMAYGSMESGALQMAVYVQPYPGPGEKHRISPENGSEPIWSPYGRELFYRQGAKFYSVTISSTSPFHAEAPHPLFESKPGEYQSTIVVRAWDVSPDGQRFLLLRNEEFKEKPVTQIHAVLNWIEELKRLVPFPH